MARPACLTGGTGTSGSSTDNIFDVRRGVQRASNLSVPAIFEQAFAWGRNVTGLIDTFRFAPYIVRFPCEGQRARKAFGVVPGDSIHDYRLGDFFGPGFCRRHTRPSDFSNRFRNSLPPKTRPVRSCARIPFRKPT
jgi:hypothetical protein